MKASRQQLLVTLAEISDLHPDWRFGQMVANLTDRAREPGDATQAAAALWDMEDDELLQTAQQFLASRRSELNPGPTST
jgi:hypothetical protein